MVTHWSLINSKSPQVYRTFFSILADLNNSVVWMISTLPLISKSSHSCTNPLVTVPSVLITTDITVSSVFHSSSKVLELTSLFAFFPFYPVISRSGWLLGKSQLFLDTITRSGRLAKIGWSVYLIIILYALFSRTDSVLCVYHLFVRSN